MFTLSTEDIEYYKELGTTVCPNCGLGILPVERGGVQHRCATDN